MSPTRTVRFASLFLLLFLPLIFGMETRVDPATDEIRTIYGRAPTQPYQYALEDPRIQILSTLPWLTYANPAQDLDYARRLARIYLPRSKERLLETTDLIVLDDIDSAIFPTKNLVWFKEAVYEDGLGAVMGGGSQGFGGNPPFTGWGETPLYPIIPVECPHESRFPKSYLVKFKVVAPENELAASLPWENAPLYYPPNEIPPKDGCKLLIVSDDDKRTPIFFYWDIGEGRFVGVQSIKAAFGKGYNEWEFFQDSILNTLYFSVDFPIPGDVEIVHQLREKWTQYHLRIKLLMSLIDFADQFGANTREITTGIDSLEEMRSRSDQLYMEAEYSESLDLIKAVIEDIDRLEELSIELKDRALTWIYIVEWLAVFATLMISGFILWTVMIRRSLYRDVRVTSDRQE